MVLLERQNPLVAELAQLRRHGAALDGQIIRQLLARKGDVERLRALPLRLGGEIGQQLFLRRALAQIRRRTLQW
jgi:hypothetical protein